MCVLHECMWFLLSALVYVVYMPVWMQVVSLPAWVHVADVQLIMLASTMTHLALPQLHTSTQSQHLLSC